ncbi:GNAT family acetyltransferase [Cellulomonas bogoriensis 69B4 = DSM 16987]|uniref:GNAT family acetyltransferase n=1 Tax=Cellulomonas bogoriensis 69B4 = DSM 16987 TaxID=1386082 RepID=A0A0A0BVI9_9CELL|nr:GNAT family acetyltransferase [Cellulomonas bogoriensis 69B4 = DSM 16987]
MRTDRLLLRPWVEADLEPFARMNADPAVMEHFPSVLTRQDSDALAARARAHIDEHGWGLWAVEVADGAHTGTFAGFTGLAVPRFAAHFTPCVEVGWRLARWAWGSGYATEAARAALHVAFTDLHLDEVVSFTARSNTRSTAVMRRLGMTHDPADDFRHPSVPADHPSGDAVLHRLDVDAWREQQRLNPTPAPR